MKEAQTHLIIGFGISLDIKKTKELYSKNNHFLKIHGDSKSFTDVSGIDLSKANTVIIYAHGKIENAAHTMLLPRPNSPDATVCTPTATIFEGIKSKVNVEILSCASGELTDKIHHLPMGSTLKILVSSKHSCNDVVNNKLIFKATRFLYLHNPFAKYIFNLLTNPENNNFAIHIGDGDYPIFTSSIDNIEDFSGLGIKKWHHEEIRKFLQFLEEIKDRANEEHKKQIDQTLKLLNTDIKIEKWIADSNTIHYQELFLLNAVINNFPKITKLVIDSGVSINTIYNKKFTILYEAATEGKKDIVKLLVENGANIDAKSFTGQTALFPVTYLNLFDIALFLLKSGANIESKDDEGYTILWYFIVGFGRIDVAQFLLDNGANINSEVNGQTIIQCIASSERVDIFKFLLKSGASTKNTLQRKTIAELTHSKAILDEMTLFETNPIEYILKNNDNVESQLRALENLSKQDHLSHLHNQIKEVKTKIESVNIVITSEEEDNILIGEGVTLTV